MVDRYRAPAAPIWWTNASCAELVERMDHAGSVRALCIRRKTWFDARAVLGGHPKKLSDCLDGEALDQLVHILEKGKKKKRGKKS